MYMYMYVYVCVYVCVYICVYIYVCIYNCITILWDTIYKYFHLQICYMLRRPTNITVYIDTSLDFT